MTGSGDSERRRGQVTFRSSRLVTVRADGRDWECELRGRLRRDRHGVVVGDLVDFTPSATDSADSTSVSGVVERVHERRNWLSRRREVGGGSELIVAANIDQVVAVFAIRQPRLKFGALDRLLIAAERHELMPQIVINKTDLGIGADVERQLDHYRAMGYPVISVSALREEGLEHFRELLLDRASVVSGPSGVGKSSLLSRVLGIDIRVGEVSRHNEKGRHTTTAVTWYPIDDRGAVIDTPGFRDYGLWQLEPRDLARYMPDLARYIADCRFSNCEHDREPGCAVRAAADQGELAPERFQSYRHILASLREH